QKIFTATPAGEVDYFNGQWMDFTGLTFEQIRDWGWLQFIHPDDVAENVRSWEYSIETGEPFYLQHRFRRADGTYRWHVSRAHAMRDAAGKLVMWIGSNTDIEEIRQAKEEVERASRTKDEFLAALSHELRTPLTPVLMTLSTMRDETRLPLDVRDQLSMMKRNIELEARLIDDLLDLTRIAKGKLALRVESCDAHSLVALAIEMVRSEALRKRQTVEVDLAAHRSLITGDPARLQQVFWNVLKNAVKFTPESGRLAVRSHDVEDQLVIEVSDTGIGIDQASMERIFLPFEQAASLSAHHRFGGLGLGLSISRAIVDLHGGAIHAASVGQGSGATFRVELPAAENLLAAISNEPRRLEEGGSVERPPETTAAKPLRLLLVEDNEPTLAVLERLLTRAGHSVTTSMTVAGALATAAGPVRFDALISDIGLPDGTGFDLMEKLRNVYGLQGIALSGYGMDEDLRRSREAGFAAHLTKPIDFAQLERALTTIASPAQATK
ncbi:MAG: ATP-binding protein, partial [Verrucomicrobiota bacterium]|nr:ATP-binding protein [Verrucomicrobiota bacterium]